MQKATVLEEKEKNEPREAGKAAQRGEQTGPHKKWRMNPKK